MVGKIIPPAAPPPTQYYIIKFSKVMKVPAIDFSQGIPPTERVTLQALQTNDAPLPAGITVDTSVKD